MLLPVDEEGGKWKALVRMSPLVSGGNEDTGFPH